MSGTFGPYLVGVLFQPGFVATVANDTTNSVTNVTYSIDNGAAIPADSLGNHRWKIPYDVGKLAAGVSHTLTVATVQSGTPIMKT